jgi:predicted transcriptional regulator
MTDTVVDWMQPNDGDILASLSRTGPEYGPVIAYQLDIDNETFERYCGRLTDNGVLERVSEEPLYRLTTRGQQLVDRDPVSTRDRLAAE